MNEDRSNSSVANESRRFLAPSERRCIQVFGLPIGLLTIVNLLPLVGLLDSRAGPIFGIYGAEPMLLAIWFALAPLRLRVQIPFAALCALALLLTGFIGGSIFTPIGFLFIAYAGIFGSASLMAWYYRWIGWRLVPRDWPNSLPTGRPVRFTLRQMLLGPALVGMVLAARSEPVLIAIRGTIFGLIGMVVLVPTLSLMLAKGRSRTSKLFDAAIVLSCGCFILRGLLTGRERTEIFFEVLLPWYLVCVGCFSWLRLCGFRLERSQPAPLANQSLEQSAQTCPPTT